jgi:hypothetical protein
MSLLDAGIADIDIYESAPEVEELGVGINALPHGARELAELGLLDELSDIAISADQANSWVNSWAAVASLPNLTASGPITRRWRISAAGLDRRHSTRHRACRGVRERPDESWRQIRLERRVNLLPGLWVLLRSTPFW